VTKLRARWSALLDRQHRQPQGLIGRLIGERMVRQHGPETNWGVDLLDVQPGDRVLELGFGAGRGLALLAQRSAEGRVVGVDLSATMVRAARRRNRAAMRAGRMALLRGDLAALPFNDGRFDKILSIHTFYFWPEPLLVCATLLRLLRPGGICAIVLSTGHIAADGALVYG